MEKPLKKERKERIKGQNAKRKKPPLIRELKTREEFDRQMEGFAMLIFGLMRIVDIDLSELIEKEQFPSEIDVE
jgi:hypothetical protein